MGVGVGHELDAAVIEHCLAAELRRLENAVEVESLVERGLEESAHRLDTRGDSSASRSSSAVIGCRTVCSARSR